MEAKNKKSNKPRLVGDIVTEMLQGWHRNTELSVDLKTILRTDERLQAGKDYLGILRRDVECEDYYYDEHITFINFKPLKIDEDFCLEQYAIGVSNELLWALEGLIEE